MGCNSKLYFENRVDLNDIVNVIENEFKTEVDTSLIHEDNGKPYGRIFFKVYCKTISLWYQSNNWISGGERDKTDPDTLDGKVEDYDILKQIAKYFGGYVVKNDCGDKPEIYIEKSKGSIELNNKELLNNLIRTNLGFKDSEKFLNFIKENRNELKELL
jgi:hypothetical protein